MVNLRATPRIVVRESVAEKVIGLLNNHSLRSMRGPDGPPIDRRKPVAAFVDSAKQCPYTPFRLTERNLTFNFMAF
jgi:hypothetical protein